MFIGVPLGWLDVLVCLFAAGAAVFGFLMLIEDPGPRKGRLAFRASMLFASFLILCSCDSVATRLIAGRGSFAGTVLKRSSTGGKSPSCDLTLADSDGNRTWFTGGFSCGRLVAGEQVSVTFTTFNREAIRLDVLSGADAGTHLSDSWPFRSVLFFGLGLWVIYKALDMRNLNPDADAKVAHDLDHPVSDVDDESLLHLD